jgi:Ras-related protein Rab-4B
VQYTAKDIQTNSNTIQLQLWDTAGQERFKSITRAYYRDAQAALVVFDITSTLSFDRVPQWISDLLEGVGTDIPIVLVGNKSDLTEERAVAHETALEFADARKMDYVETSAKTGENIAEVFMRCALEVESRMREDGADGLPAHPVLSDAKGLGPRGTLCSC